MVDSLVVEGRDCEFEEDSLEEDTVAVVADNLLQGHFSKHIHKTREALTRRGSSVWWITALSTWVCHSD